MPINYKNDPVANRNLINTILDYYRKHPHFGEAFAKRIDIRTRWDDESNGFIIESNIGSLMSNVVYLEEKYLTDV